ncbi:IS66 family transposase [Paracoccus spongiarum]|uniref:Transposase n=1 Tax=Paracoccus spongiarum TaxID=3064387 RepID=A0ABT9JBH1_9RHOB|nr:transposase [Paracoccus sp. 2205BS29-5]MDP5307183.1 transposase [Paracoccus sp. 2205BS29-5]
MDAPPRSSPRSAPWLETRLSHIPQTSQVAKDGRHALARWPGLIRLLEQGTLEGDTSPVERRIRPIALSRKNAFFAAHDIGAETRAMLASLVAPRKLPGADPIDDIAETLRAVLEGNTQVPPRRPHTPRTDLARQAPPHRTPPSRLRRCAPGADKKTPAIRLRLARGRIHERDLP